MSKVLAARTLTRPSLVYMQASEHNARASFDLNLYPANLTLAEITDEVSAIANFLGRPGSELTPYYQQCKYATLGHISGGYDRSGEPFFTIYYEEV
ncbi:MAG: hypothetical protein WD002_11990 [Pseudomonadales bacterium]